MKQETRYYRNLARFAVTSPLLACQLETIDCSALEFCRTYIGELNLVDRQQQPPLYLYAQEGAAWEAQEWTKIQKLDATDVLFIYGLGLGYYYFALRDWLAARKGRYLVFIEDDLRVLKRFMETEQASQILADQRVVIQGAPFLRRRDYAWKDLCRDAPWVFWAFGRAEARVSALQAYFMSRFEFFASLAAQWYAALGRARRRLNEFTPPLTDPVFRNFYANLPYIWQSVPASALFDELPRQPLPAVLAGAGPSLAQQLPRLAQLPDKALLLAGGSGMNALTHAGITPHFGTAIDPTPTQVSRQLTSFAFEVPVFYKNCYCDEAFLHLHGPRVYAGGSGDYPIAAWFEKWLGIECPQEIISGVSSSNFLLEIAGLLGCNPIILVGTDLAYSQGARYAPGVRSHPTDSDQEKGKLAAVASDRLAVPGVGGQEVMTTMQWVLEGISMSGFKERHPHTAFLNATEGGMPIMCVPNVCFQDTADALLTRAWDIQGLVHGALQNAAAACDVDADSVMEAIDTWKVSLEKSLEHIGRLQQALQGNQARFKRGEKLPFGPYSGQAALWQVELQQEAAYENLLKVFDGVFDAMHKKTERSLLLLRGTRKGQGMHLSHEIRRMRFLQKQARYHLDMLERGLGAHHAYMQALEIGPAAERVPAPPPAEAADYCLQPGRIAIDEPALGLCVTADFCPRLVPEALRPVSGQESGVAAIMCEEGGRAEGQALSFYPGGQLKVEAYYAGGQLHGPWSYYGVAGNLLVRSWYVHGQRQGRTCYYYSDGTWYCMQTYRHGRPHGTWRYYYPDGTLKTEEHYLDGSLDGSVHLYYPNGRLKKELYFTQGRQCGRERLWAASGELVSETSYGEG